MNEKSTQAIYYALLHQDQKGKLYYTHKHILIKGVLVIVLKNNFKKPVLQYACLNITSQVISDLEFFDDKELGILVHNNKGK